jgi:hypothetical protein
MSDKLTLPMRLPVPTIKDGELVAVMAPATLTMENFDSRDGFVTRVTLTCPVRRKEGSK